jgi:xylan 1,4-beta-xylosidase
MACVSNPVLSGFHPDPSILQMGDEYFIANSTFEWYPGVKIASMNWRVLSVVTTRRINIF